jgi:hypothetical protein
MYKMQEMRDKIRILTSRWPNQKGNAMAYVVMVMIIFGIIGAVMASLLTSAVTSSATANHSRRALYMTEAGMRYGLSQLRNNEFATGVIDDLNNTTYTLSAEETFTLNIFGPWFDSASDQNISSGGSLTLKVPEGTLPQDFIIPANIWIVNYDYIDSPSTSTTPRDPISGFSRIDDTTLTINCQGNFIVSKNEQVCLAVQPISTMATQPISEGRETFCPNLMVP